MARGGARPGAGRPSAAANEERKSLPARMQAKSQEKLQRRLPELVDRYLDLALEGDKDALKWCIERAMGKAAVAQQAAADTEIRVVLGSIPRPGRANEARSAGQGDPSLHDDTDHGGANDGGGSAIPMEDVYSEPAEGAEEEEKAVK